MSAHIADTVGRWSTPLAEAAVWLIFRACRVRS